MERRPVVPEEGVLGCDDQCPRRGRLPPPPLAGTKQAAGSGSEGEACDARPPGAEDEAEVEEAEWAAVAGGEGRCWAGEPSG